MVPDPSTPPAGARARRVALAPLLVLLLGAVTGGDRPPLVEAARTGDQATLRALVERGADVDERDADGSTALLWASHRDELADVDLLLDAGADPNLANDLGATPLWAASQNGSRTVVERLLDAGADPDLALRRGETPLIAAARAGSAPVARLLLEHGADPDATGPRDQTALMWAAAQRHPSVVAVLLDHGADVRARSETRLEMKAHEPHAHPENQAWFPHGGNTALLFATRVGDLASARHLVAAGADVNDTTGFGVSAVAMAAYSDFGVFVAEPTFSQGGPYHLGGREGFRPGEFQDLVAFLLQEGADPDLGAHRFTALHAAVLRRNEGTVELLLEHGADPELPLATFTPHTRGSSTAFYFHNGWIGATPAWLAARFGSPAILRRLLEAGADPAFVHHGSYWGGRGGPLGGGVMADRQEEETTLLHAALGMSGTGRAWVHQYVCSPEHEAEVLEKARLLVGLGADVNRGTLEGRRPLDQALLYGWSSVADYLASVGAEATKAEPDEEGEQDFFRRRAPCEGRG